MTEIQFHRAVMRVAKESGDQLLAEAARRNLLLALLRPDEEGEPKKQAQGRG